MRAIEVLEEFVRDIEDAGGVVQSESGETYPVGDPSWPDLGATYLKACEVLGRKPKLAKEDEDDGCEFCDGDGEKPGGTCGACHGEGR